MQAIQKECSKLTRITEGCLLLMEGIPPWRIGHELDRDA